MKLTKNRLKQIIREELSSLKELEQPQLKSGVGKTLAQKIASAPGVENLLKQLKDKDPTQAAEFVAHMAQLLDVDLTGQDVSRTKAAQTRMQKDVAAAAPPEEEPQGI